MNTPNPIFIFDNLSKLAIYFSFLRFIKIETDKITIPLAITIVDTYNILVSNF
jgi:hypothetical protein